MKFMDDRVLDDRVPDDRAPGNRDSDDTATDVKTADAKSTDAKIAQMKTAIVSAIDAIDAKDRIENAADGDQDRREVTRTRVLRGAKIIVQARSPVIHCTVQNITSGGACLKLANTCEHSGQFRADIRTRPHAARLPRRLAHPRHAWRGLRR